MGTLIGVGRIVFVLAVGAGPAGAKDLAVLGGQVDAQPAGTMMYRYLMGQVNEASVRWEVRYEKIKTPAEIASYQKRLREAFLKALGPFPPRTDLNARVTGTIKRKGYRVDKVIFESRPGFHVTAAMFLPEGEKYKKPYPGVLVPCGHAHDAKAYETYQSMGAALALNGMAALVFDPVDQGERMQILNDKGKEIMWGTAGHTNLGVGCILVGLNTATYEIWDSMRGLDYLQSRPEVDANRLGCTGNSGGGTQTSQVMALDGRIKAAAPSCYLNALARQVDNSPGDAEQNIFAQLAWGMEHADYIMMRAPRPVIILAATKDFFDIRATWRTFRFAKRLYTRMGFSERVDLLENDAKHNYNRLQRQGGVRWLSRWLCGVDAPIVEPDIELIPVKELWATPRGQVMLVKGARSAYDLNEEYERKLAAGRRRLWADTPRSDLLKRIATLAGIRKLAELPKPKVETVGRVQRKGYIVEKIILRPEKGIVLPALQFAPARSDPKAAPVLYVDSRGKAAGAGPGGAIEKLVAAGTRVLAVDLRGWGETSRTRGRALGTAAGRDWPDYYKAYNLGRSYVGMRAEDILVCARHLGETAPAPRRVRLIAVAHAAVPAAHAAAHAAALAGDLFESVALSRSLRSWQDVLRTRKPVEQLQNTVHAALTVYDLPDLAAVIGRKFTVAQPVDAEGRALQPKP